MNGFQTHLLQLTQLPYGKLQLVSFILAVLFTMFCILCWILSSANMAPSVQKVQTNRRKWEIAKRKVHLFALYIMWQINEIHRDY